ncbi:MAG TPA: Gfo/Idh/MocA family oxidoreductase [Chloroflexota bacterium]|nr:Gfo/Idh/MocA family oxidoreductase [Chloroflexota bacterium]
MNEPIRVGIVGCGRILPAHLRGYATLRQLGHDNFRITALYSPKRRDAEMFRKRGEGPPPRSPVSKVPGDPLSAPHSYVSDFQPDVEAQVFDSFDDLLASGTVDSLDIPASVFAHHAYTVKAADAGKHVLVQKPFSVSVAAGREMVAAAKRNGVTLGVTENVRYAEGSRVARWAIERGYLGDVQMVASIGIGTAEWSPDKVVADTPWRHSQVLAGGGPTLDIGVHLFHRVRYLCGEVERVGAVVRTFEPTRYRRDEHGNVVETIHPDADDAFMATFELANGGIGQMSFTWAGHGEPTGLPDGMVVYGSKGCLKGGRLLRDGEPPIDVRDLFRSEASPAERGRWLPISTPDGFAMEFYDFFGAIERHGQPEASGEEGLRDVAAAFSILESSHAGHPVLVADVLSGKVRAAQKAIDEHYGLA